MTKDKLQALAELKKLLDAGIINDIEFDQQKKKILSTDRQEVKAKPNHDRTEAEETKRGIWIIVGLITLIIIITIVLITKGNSTSSPSPYDEEYTIESDTICVDTTDLPTELYDEGPYYGEETVNPYDALTDDWSDDE